jgi:hypothetical protein
VKVDALVSTYRVFNSNAYAAIQAMLNHTRGAGIDLHVPALHGSALVHRARNAALYRIRPDAEYVLFCDDDMAPQKDALLRLLSLRLPVVSAHTVTRELPPQITAKIWDDKDEQFCKIERIRPDRVITGKLGVGTGFLLVQKAVIDKAIEWHLDGFDWLEENRRMFDRLHVRADLREKERDRVSTIRRHNCSGNDAMALLLFEFVKADNQLEMGEDTSFCWKLIHMGVDIALDPQVKVGHVGDMPYSPDLLDCDDPMDLIKSACQPDYPATLIHPEPTLVV